jgi:hypothetical protein
LTVESAQAVSANKRWMQTILILRGRLVA